MRSRMLNPELFKDETLASAPVGATLLFAGLWCLAEDSGCLEDRPRVIRSEVFGLRDDVRVEEVEEWVNLLVGSGKIERYEANGRPYLFITHFHRYQRFKYLPKGAHPLPEGLAEEIARRYPKGKLPEDSGDADPFIYIGDSASGTFRNIPASRGRAKPSQAQAKSSSKPSTSSKPSASQAETADHPEHLAGTPSLAAAAGPESTDQHLDGTVNALSDHALAEHFREQVGHGASPSAMAKLREVRGLSPPVLVTELECALTEAAKKADRSPAGLALKILRDSRNGAQHGYDAGRPAADHPGTGEKARRDAHVVASWTGGAD